MGFDSIQLGLDIATSVSILGASLAFLVNHVKEKKRSRQFAVSEMRLKYMQESIGELTSLIRDVHSLQDKVAWARVEEGGYSSKDIVQMGFNVQMTGNILLSTSFAVWAREDEKVQIETLIQQAKQWSEQWAKALVDEGDPPTFTALIDHLSSTVKHLSLGLRNEMK